MKQFFTHYKYWEDYNNGMYSIEKKINESELINHAIILLENNDLFYSICKELVIKWPISTKVNLTNKQCNRKAWLGQAACSFKYQVPEILTRIAWGKISPIKQYEADAVAIKIINNFELNYENKNKELCFQF